MILYICIFASGKYFEYKESQTFITTEADGQVSALNLISTGDMTLADKLAAINGTYTSYTMDLSYTDYDAFYSSLVEVISYQINEFMGDYGGCFTEDGISNINASKLMIVPNSSTSSAFTVTEVSFLYYGFSMNVTLDTETNTILGLYMNMTPSKNSIYSEDELTALVDYQEHIAPVSQFIQMLCDSNLQINETADLLMNYYSYDGAAMVYTAIESDNTDTDADEYVSQFDITLKDSENDLTAEVTCQVGTYALCYGQE